MATETDGLVKKLYFDQFQDIDQANAWLGEAKLVQDAFDSWENIQKSRCVDTVQSSIRIIYWGAFVRVLWRGIFITLSADL